jgi:hypothetical protein
VKAFDGQRATNWVPLVTRVVFLLDLARFTLSATVFGVVPVPLPANLRPSSFWICLVDSMISPFIYLPNDEPVNLRLPCSWEVLIRAEKE